MFFTFKRAIELLAQANPNMLEVLFIRADCVRRRIHGFSRLEEKRAIFVTQQCVETRLNYASTHLSANPPARPRAVAIDLTHFEVQAWMHAKLQRHDEVQPTLSARRAQTWLRLNRLTGAMSALAGGALALGFQSRINF